MNKKINSRVGGFHRLALGERRALLSEVTGVDVTPCFEPLAEEIADSMVENVVGTFDMPLGVATNFRINGEDIFVPMAIEEPSVIAAASNAARMVRASGGFTAEADPAHMVAQIELLEPRPGADELVLTAKDELLALANELQPELVSLGGGARDIRVRPMAGGKGRTVIHLVVDCLDAMGANSVNTMAEGISGRLAELTDARVGLRILTNLADLRLARAHCSVPFDALGRSDFAGRDVALGVVAASHFASADPYRAATHNKGIFNGIDAVLIATGNDWRAVEAGGHAFAARSGIYSPLATWSVEGEELNGQIELPMAVGIVGGSSRAHPTARWAIEMMAIERAAQLACVAVTAGLATNLAALAALSSEGIQRGHMRLHHRKQP